jgi:hypothetical protein
MSSGYSWRVTVQNADLPGLDKMKGRLKRIDLEVTCGKVILSIRSQAVPVFSTGSRSMTGGRMTDDRDRRRTTEDG